MYHNLCWQRQLYWHLFDPLKVRQNVFIKYYLPFITLWQNRQIMAECVKFWRPAMVSDKNDVIFVGFIDFREKKSISWIFWMEIEANRRLKLSEKQSIRQSKGDTNKSFNSGRSRSLRKWRDFWKKWINIEKFSHLVIFQKKSGIIPGYGRIVKFWLSSNGRWKCSGY